MELHARITEVRSNLHLRTEVAAAADAGFRGITMGDHIYDERGLDRHDPLVALAAVCDLTDGLVLGTSVLNMAIRDAFVTVRQFAELAFLSEGRTILGLGAGWHQAELALVRRPVPNLQDRLRMLEHSLILGRALFDGTSIPEGHAVSDRYQLTPVPRVRPTVAVGGGSRGVLRLAARYADHVDVNASLASPGTNGGIGSRVDDHRAKLATTRDGLANRIRSVREGAAEWGRPEPTFSITVAFPGLNGQVDATRQSPFFVSSDPQEAIDELEALSSSLPLTHVNLPLSPAGRHIATLWRDSHESAR
jgi:alkanesulfonate monooxygenase SsuD/methylene tetrahydromethanopterin reductase-like flavin-dependent oxidoreductase (luciferase family)